MFVFSTLFAVLIMSSPTEAPKETSTQDLSADATVSANSTVQTDNRMVEKQDQANRVAQNAVSVALETPSPATPATPVVVASPVLPQHFQVMSQVASNAATQTAQVRYINYDLKLSKYSDCLMVNHHCRLVVDC